MIVKVKWVAGTVILLLMHIKDCYGSSRVMFPGCSRQGFSCITKQNNNIELTYACSSGLDDVFFYINEFRAPSNTQSFKIENCSTLTLYTKCSGERKSIQKLHILNIKRLIFKTIEGEPMLPPTVVLENILHIDSIPATTFGQINKAVYPRDCFQQATDFQNIYFNNVSIGTVERAAFVALEKFKNFAFVNVNINEINAGAFQLKHDLNGSFDMHNCTIKRMEHLAIQIYAKTAVFTGNYFTEIPSSGIDGTFENFYFTKNVVETLQAHAFTLLTNNIFILENKFSHVWNKALEKLGPGLLQYFNLNFGRLKFRFDFSKNELNYVEPGSLHPDYVSYENVQTEMMFSRNKFLCTCKNLGWMFSDVNHGSETNKLEDFYKMILDESYVNTCTKPSGTSCDLPLKSVSQMTKCGKCLKNVTLETICAAMERKSDTETATDGTVSVSEVWEATTRAEFEKYSSNSLDSSSGDVLRVINYLGVFGLILIRFAI